MQLDGLWTLHALLALSSFALGNPGNPGNPMSNDPMAAPRVFISFKGKNLNFMLHSFLLTCLSFLVCNWCSSSVLVFFSSTMCLLSMTDDLTVV